MISQAEKDAPFFCVGRVEMRSLCLDSIIGFECLCALELTKCLDMKYRVEKFVQKVNSAYKMRSFLAAGQ